MRKCVEKCKSHSLIMALVISGNYFLTKLTVKYGCILIMAKKYKFAYKQIITIPNIIDGYNDKT